MVKIAWEAVKAGRAKSSQPIRPCTLIQLSSISSTPTQSYIAPPSRPSMTSTLPLPTPLPRPLSLSLSAPPNTDIWRKPPSTNAFNAPIRWSVLPLAKFKSARVCVWGKWRTRFDQGGVFFGLPGEVGLDVCVCLWVLGRVGDGDGDGDGD